MTRDFHKIKAWKHADDLALSIYSVTKCFPKEEIYGITSQLRRAAVSVAANIVEGATRQHKKDYLNFLCNAKASLAEVEYLLHLSQRLKYIAESSFYTVEQLIQETAKTLFGLINAVKKEVVT